MYSWRRLPLGRRGEHRAASFLRRRGLRILAHSYNSGAAEVDLVARDGDVIVFVEVKTRSASDHGEPWQAVDAGKRRRITKAAVAYLKQHRLTNHPVRFDIVAVIWPPGWFVRPTIEHFENAFEASGPWSV